MTKFFVDNCDAGYPECGSLVEAIELSIEIGGEVCWSGPVPALADRDILVALDAGRITIHEALAQAASTTPEEPVYWPPRTTQVAKSLDTIDFDRARHLLYEADEAWDALSAARQAVFEAATAAYLAATDTAAALRRQGEASLARLWETEAQLWWNRRSAASL